MLTTTKTSRTRLIAGAGVLSLCVAAGLGLTASGTAAAAKMRSTVEDATGVDLASLDQAAATPPAAVVVPVVPADPAAPSRPALRVHEHRDASDLAGPGLPPAPEPPLQPSSATAAAPPEPPTPVSGKSAPGMTTTVTVTKDGKRIVRYGRYVKLDRDGSYTVVGEIAPVPPMRAIPPMPVMPPMRALPPIPQVSSRSCGARGKNGSMVIKESYAGGHRIIVCTDRIAAAAAKGAAIAANSANIERGAYASALSGLRDARARMLSDTDMSVEARKRALEGIDTAIKEVESDLAKVE